MKETTKNHHQSYMYVWLYAGHSQLVWALQKNSILQTSSNYIFFTAKLYNQKFCALSTYHFELSINTILLEKKHVHQHYVIHLATSSISQHYMHAHTCISITQYNEYDYEFTVHVMSSTCKLNAMLNSLKYRSMVLYNYPQIGFDTFASHIQTMHRWCQLNLCLS